jgi:murein hydrolase activator
MNIFLPALLISYSYLLSFTPPCWSEEVLESLEEVEDLEQAELHEEAKTRLSSVRERVTSQQRQLKRLEQRQNTLRVSIKSTDLLISKIRDKHGSMLREIEKNNRTQRSLKQQATDLEQEQEHLTALFRNRLKGLYMQSRGFHRSASAFFQRVSAFDRRAIAYGKIVAEHDNKTISALQQLNERFKNTHKELRQRQEKNRSLLHQYKELGGELSQRQVQRRKLVEDFEQQQEKVNTVIYELNQESIRLEQLVSSIISPGVSEVSNEGSDEEALSSDIYRGEYLGEGLPQTIPLPVEGVVNRHFGREALTEFADYVMRKGVTIQAKGLGTVRTVGDGVVRFVGNFPGFNKVVIVDHGQRFYSLYGDLGKVIVTLGSVVEVGEELAQTNDKKELYFEVRQNGIPRDPEPFFAIVGE